MWTINCVKHEQSPIGIVAFALTMALVSAYIDGAHVKNFNDALDAMLP